MAQWNNNFEANCSNRAPRVLTYFNCLCIIWLCITFTVAIPTVAHVDKWAKSMGSHTLKSNIRILHGYIHLLYISFSVQNEQENNTRFPICIKPQAGSAHLPAPTWKGYGEGVKAMTTSLSTSPLTQHGVVKRKLGRVSRILGECIETTREEIPQQPVSGHMGVQPVLDDLDGRDRGN